VAGALALGGSSARPASAEAPAADTRLSEEVRGLASAPCGSCHRRSLATAKPAALAVFDLDAAAAAWPSAMTARQLQAFLQRLDGKLDARTRPRVRAWVAAETALRKQRAGRR
jgi:hypothetical protein